jgi:hypothetical protein
MSGFNAFLIWLLCIGIAALIIGYFLKKSNVIKKHEGFQAINRCPDNSEQIIDDRGRSNCCKGDIVQRNGQNFCSGNIICSLTESFTQGRKTVPLCSDYARDNNAERSKNLCPDIMQNYYFQDSTKSFCSKSPSIPPDLNQPYCVLYNNSTSDTNFLDSCQNFMKKREMEASLRKCETDLKALKEQCPVNPSGSSSTPTVTAPAGAAGAGAAGAGGAGAGGAGAGAGVAGVAGAAAAALAAARATGGAGASSVGSIFGNLATTAVPAARPVV